MSARPVTSRRARVALILMTIVLLVAVPTGAMALWSQSVRLAGTASAGTVSTPEAPRCATRGGAQTSAEITWEAPAGQEISGYRVLVDDGNDVSVVELDEGTTSITLDRGLLTNLVAGLLELLLGGGRVEVSVEAVHASGWTSAPSGSLPVAGSVFGIRCA